LHRLSERLFLSLSHGHEIQKWAGTFFWLFHFLSFTIPWTRNLKMGGRKFPFFFISFVIHYPMNTKFKNGWEKFLSFSFLLPFTIPWTQNPKKGGEKFKVVGLDFYIYIDENRSKEKN